MLKNVIKGNEVLHKFIDKGAHITLVLELMNIVCARGDY